MQYKKQSFFFLHCAIKKLRGGAWEQGYIYVYPGLVKKLSRLLERAKLALCVQCFLNSGGSLYTTSLGLSPGRAGEESCGMEESEAITSFANLHFCFACWHKHSSLPLFFTVVRSYTFCQSQVLYHGLDGR